ncbi:uncharacterized protein LOC124694293 [Lolium rigidum]|uniref:uncharacterized protein LOC124694293 n=1 Tax=Lolium rigidum TaxID=89674 RepID=UPI001F5D1D71|nr:uncharacterized protein LOC124694293 [Lolium rigidum]
MAAAAAAAPPPRSTTGPSPPDPAELGFRPPFSDTPPPPPPLPGTQVGPLSRLSGEDLSPDLKPCQGFEGAPDTKDVRTPESSEFFLREPESSDKKLILAREAFTDEQWVQLHAQILISGYLTHGRAPKETNMILAFGEPVEGQKHAWEEVWRAALDRCQNQMSPMAGLATPPSSSLIGSCTVEQGSKDTTVWKSTISKPYRDSLQGGSGEKKTQVLDVERPTKMLEQRNGDEDHLAVSCAQKADQTLCGEGSPIAEPDSKDTAVGKTIISEPPSREILSNSLQSDGHGRASQGDESTDESTRTDAEKEHPSDELNVQPAGISPSVSYNEAVQDLSDDGNGLEQNVLDTCLKCGKSGQLLRCCSCPLAAHDSCFGSSGRFDDGQFYCPVCFYSKATKGYKRAERTLSEAKKNLSGFFGWKRFAKQQDEQSITGNQQRAAANCEKDHLNGRCASIRQASNHQAKEAANFSRKDEETCHGNPETHEVRSSSSVDEVAHSSQNGISSIANRNIKAVKENHLMNSPNCEFSAKRGDISERNMSRRKVTFQEKETGALNSHGKASGRQDQYVHSPARKRSYPYPPECYSTPARSPLAPRRRSFVSTARRARLLWTAEEEEALREAVARFAPKGKGQISWIQIREHGDGVFHPKRLPNDLRQKWNNMKKRDEAPHEGAGLAGLVARTRRASLPPLWRKEACKDGMI